MIPRSASLLARRLSPARSVPGFLGALCFLSFAVGDEVPVLPAEASDRLVELEGRKVVVHGTVESTGKSPGGTNFVNFRGTEFSLVAFRSDLDQFPDGEPAELYEGRRLAVEGAVAIYQNKPQIKLTSPSQVRILAEDEEFPPRIRETSVASAESAEAERADGDAETARDESGAESGEAADRVEEEKRIPPVDPSLYFR